MSQTNSVFASARPPGAGLRHWFLTCPRGLESLLAEEARGLGGQELRETVAGVAAAGSLEFGYRACLWSRLANRVLLRLAEVPATDAEALYAAAYAVDWPDHFDVGTSFAVDFSGSSGKIRHSGFGAQVVKDAVVDRFREACGQRPAVDRSEAELRINARLHRGTLTLALDLSGASLHRRGYRARQVTAPIKENLAAALLLRAGWPELAAQGAELLDPLCGGGTLVIEAGLMAADIAPGLLRKRFGFHAWRGHDAALWERLRAEAEARREAGLPRLTVLRGRDRDPEAIAISRGNAAAAGLADRLSFTCAEVTDLGAPGARGLLITNPPYGERLGEQIHLKTVYGQLGDALKRDCPGWRAAILTTDPQLGHALGLKAERRYRFYNGALTSELLICSVHTREQAVAARTLHEQRAAAHDAGITMLANRLRKNAKRLAPWLRREEIRCYRLYDADLPEYAVAIDRYGDAVHVQEYEAPVSVPPATARRRMDEVLAAVGRAVQPDARLVFTKVRQRQRGSRQYQPLAAEAGAGRFVVAEGSAALEVELAAYLDTGLFLDHRPVRRMIAQMAAGKRFLNLFCYTATATVQAALGGAAESLSIDLSNTYLDWARRNFALNGLDIRHHRVLRGDCLEWLAGERQGADFDLILLDPPTFSNSKRMTETLDIQRDHAALIASCMARLAAAGTLVFSTNFRRFRLAAEVAERYRVEDVSKRTLDPDFRRDARIHRCWLISHRSGS